VKLLSAAKLPQFRAGVDNARFIGMVVLFQLRLWYLLVLVFLREYIPVKMSVVGNILQACLHDLPSLVSES